MFVPSSNGLPTAHLLARQLAFALLALSTIVVGDAFAQQGDCGIAANHFNVDGQFYSTDGSFDWIQGSSGGAVFGDDGTHLLSPALYDRDPHWEGGAIDTDAFNGMGNKNNDDISPDAEPWTWAPGSGPSKNDLTDVFAYSKDIDGDIWFFLGAMTRATNGASHIDFEFNQLGFTRLGETSGTIVGNGPDAGRNADTDFIVSVDYTEGGTVPEVSFRVWRQVGSDYEFVLETADPNDVFVCTNDQTIPAPPWGAIAPDGTDSADVVPYQFVEIGLNLTNLGIDPSVFCTDASTLLFKTRSAPSFTASLKDLALYQFSIIEPPACDIAADSAPLCSGESTTLRAPDAPTGALYSYLWSGPGVDGAITPSVQANVAGLYSLTVTDDATGCSNTCTYELVVNDLPVCGIDADTDVLCDGETATFCGPEPPSGVQYSYDWRGPSGLLPDARCIQVSEAGVYTLTVTNLLTGCVSSSCERTLTVNSRPVAGIVGPALICDGETAQLCAPEGNYSYAWTGPNGFGSALRCVDGTASGTYRVVLTDLATGCQSDPASHDLTVAGNPGCAIVGPDTICPEGTVELCGPEGDLSYVWVLPDGSQRGGRCLQADAPGIYQLTVENENGCTSTCQKTLTLDENVSADELDDVMACTGQRAELCVEASGTEPITYQWSKDGQTIPSATEACYVIDAVTSDDVGEYSVEVSGKCGPPVVRSATLTLVDVSVRIRNTYWCEGQEAHVCADLNGEGPFVYEWKRDGVVIAGATGECLVIENVAEYDEGEYSVTVTGYCGVPTTASADLYVGTCEEYCGLTQGFYGNWGGKWNGMTTIELLDMLIPPGDPVVVGVPGNRSITFPDGSEHCIIGFLPGGGPSAVLDPGLGDVTVNPSTCEFMAAPNPTLPVNPELGTMAMIGSLTADRRLLLDDEGRFRNTLLSQTLTLSLNVRLDPGLSDMPICRHMIMIGVLPGPDGLLGTPDDVPDNDNPRFAEFPETVLNALDHLGLPHTAGGILELANHSLVGDVDGFDVSLGEVTGAVGSINDMVDKCAMMIHCADPQGRAEVDISDGTFDGALQTQLEERVPTTFSFSMLSPNPLPRGEGVHVRFAIPELSRVGVHVFDLRGRKVTEMPERLLSPGQHASAIDLQRAGRLASGVYFLRMEAVGLETGQRFGSTRKVMLLP